MRPSSVLYRAFVPVLAPVLALLAPAARAQVGWERVYTLTFQECDQPSLVTFSEGIERLPGFLDARPIACSGTACAWSYTSTIAPNELLNRLYAVVEHSGYRARIGVTGLRYSITCVPGRRVHPLAGAPDGRAVGPGFAPGFTEYATPCGTAIEAAGDVLFDYDRAAIRADAAQALEGVAARIRALRPLAVEITGHTDSRGSVAYNQALSERRAASVAGFLAGPLGLAGERLLLRGLGELEPRAPNHYPDGTDNPAGRQANRRVEIFLRTGGADCGPRPAPGAFRPWGGPVHRPKAPKADPNPLPRIDPGQW